jgi:hypothetical protein
MALRRFSPFASGAKPKGIKTRDALDVAARYFVYKLHDATRRDRIQWVPLKGIDETQATIERAVERGWAVLQRQPGGSPRQSEAALTAGHCRFGRHCRLRPWLAALSGRAFVEGYVCRALVVGIVDQDLRRPVGVDQRVFDPIERV